MKILQKMMTVIAVLVFLILAGVLVCAVNPELSQTVGRKLNSFAADSPEVQETQDEDAELEEITEKETEAVQSPSAGEDSTETKVQETQESAAAAKVQKGDGISVREYAEPYEVPAQEQLQIPAEVQGYQGLEPVQGTAEQVNESRLNEIAQHVGYGKTGEGLSFSEKTYPYYNMLDDNTKALYRQIYANAQALNERFAPIVRVSQQELRNAFMAVTGDHPELFWLETSYQCQYVPSGLVAELTLSFNRTAEQLSVAKLDFEDGAQSILDQAGNPEKGGMSAADAGEAIHDALLAALRYDTAAELNQSAYSALVNGVTVCAGYARAYQYLCQKCNIPVYFCTGYAGENHAWNIIGLDGEFYNVDATWDDAASDMHAFFYKTDEDFAQTHSRTELSVYLPPCNGETYHNTSENAELGDEPFSQDMNQLEFDPNSYYGYGDDHTLRALGEIGIAEQDVKNTLKDYYDACYEQTTSAAQRSFTFQLAVSDYQLMEDIYNSYVNRSYEEGYGKRALAQLGVSSWDMRVNIEALQGDRYLITHTVIY